MQVSRLRQFSTLLRRRYLSTSTTPDYTVSPPSSQEYKTPGPPITRLSYPQRFTTGPYEVPNQKQPIYPKRKSPFKRAAGIMEALNKEEGLRMMYQKRAIFPVKIPNPRSGMIIRITYTHNLQPGAVPQCFTGLCISVRKRGVGSTIILRNIVDGVAVERGFPFFSPLIKNAEILGLRRFRKAKLYYLRERPPKESFVQGATARPWKKSK